MNKGPGVCSALSDGSEEGVRVCACGRRVCLCRCEKKVPMIKQMR